MVYLYKLLLSHSFIHLFSKYVSKSDRKATAISLSFLLLGLLPVRGKKRISLNLGKQTHLSLQEACRYQVYGVMAESTELERP